ncbi:MAG: type IV pilus modification PilV family protein [Nitrospinota bacterium]
MLKVNRGFSLLEIAVALGILSIVFVTLISSSNRALVLIARSHTTTQATIIARDQIERLELETILIDSEPVIKELDDYPQYKIRYRAKKTEYDEVIEIVVDLFLSDDEEMTPIVEIKSFREAS